MVLHWVFLIAWTMHGLGHVAGVLGAFLPAKASGFKSENPWILPGDVLVTGPVGKFWEVFWISAMVMIVWSSFGLFLGEEWWRQWAAWGAVASLVAIVPWARTVMPGALAGAAFDVAVLITLLVPLDSVLAVIEK